MCITQWNVIPCASGIGDRSIQNRRIKRSALPSAIMVFVVDDGSEFKVPVDKLWKYAQSQTEHAHPSMKNVKVTQEGQGTVLTFDVVAPDGSTEKRKTRITPMPPVGTWFEELEGKFAGSKYFNYYTPKGEKTGVTVVGEWVSSTIPADRMKKAVLEHLAIIFKEDEANLTTFK